jgi:carbon monoxide dehydrogenase subunit G
VDIQGEYSFAAAREAVFAVMTDPEALKRALPGCTEFRETSPQHFHVALSVNLVVLSINATAQVALIDREPPVGYRIQVNGEGSYGTLAVDGRFTFEPIATGTLMRYDLGLEVTGKFALLGAPVIEPATKLLVAQLFGALDKEALALPAGAVSHGRS